MVNLKLGQDGANKRERKQTAAHTVVKSYLIVSCYGSLIIINPSVIGQRAFL